MSKSKKYSTLILLSAMAGIMYLTPFLRYNFYDQMVSALNLTDAQLGVIGSFYGIFTLFLYILSGIIAEKFNTKKIIVFSGFGMFLTTVWYAMMPGYVALCLIHGIFGIFSCGTFWSAYIKTIRLLGPHEEQGRLYGSSEGIRGVMQAIVSFICLAVVNKYAADGVGFRLALVINAAVFLILTVACIFILPKEQAAVDVEQAEQAELKGGWLKNCGRLFKNPGLWICIFIILSTYTIWGTANSYLGTFGTRVLHLTDTMSSTLSILRSNIIVIFAGILGGILMGKFKTKARGFLVFYGIVIVCALSIMFSTGTPMVSVAFTMILTFAVNVLKAAYWSIQDDAGIPRNATGLASGLISTLAYTPEIYIYYIVPVFLGSAEAAGNVAGGFQIMFIWMICFAVLGMIVAVFLEKRTWRTRGMARQKSHKE